jgi:hypothetical protein
MGSPFWKYERSKLDRMFRVAKDFRVDQVSIFSPKKRVEVKKTRLWSWKSEGGSGKSAKKDADSSTAARRQSVEGYLSTGWLAWLLYRSIDLTHTDRIPLSAYADFNADCGILMQITLAEYQRNTFILTNMSLRQLLDDLCNDRVEGMT